MTAPDPEWVEAGYLMWCFSEGYGLPEDRVGENWLREPDERLHPDDVRQKAQLIALGRDLVAAVEPLIREQIAAEIEALPIDHRSPGRATISGLVTFARREAYLRAAAIARGGAQ